MEVVLSAEDWDKSPPSCEACDAREMTQEFKPFGIGGSIHANAARITEDIIANDYGVSNFNSDHRMGAVPKVQYKDQTANVLPSAWQKAAHNETLQQAIAIGQRNRREFKMDGLDILKRNIMDGTQPDLIEASKRRSIKVW